MDFFDRLMREHGIAYEIQRNNKVIFETEGLPNTEESTHKKYVGFKPGTDIEVGDFIVNKAGEKFYICNKVTDFVRKEPFQIKAYTIPESEYNRQVRQDHQSIFNIGEVHGSIVGTQQNAVINNGYSIEDLTAMIEQHDSLDKEILKEMISLLESTISKQEPMRKGFLSKFAGVLQRNEWITAPVAAFILEKFLL